MSYKIIKYTKKYKSSLLELLSLLWVELSKKEVEEKFEWRYEKNPNQQYFCTFIAVSDKCKVVGSKGCVIQEFCYGDNKTIRVYNPCDTVIHPHFRRKGIYTGLTLDLVSYLNSIESNGIYLNLSSNKKTTLGAIKNGWQKTNSYKYYAYKLSILNYFKKTEKYFDKEIYHKNEYDIEITKECKVEQLTNLNCNKRDENKIQNKRDEKFYNWRYSHKAERYHFLYLYGKNHLKAYLILEQKTQKQFSILEYYADTPNLFRLMAKLAMKKLQITLLRTWSLSTEQEKFLGKSGFIKESPKIIRLLGKDRLPIITRPIGKNIEEKDFFLNEKDTRRIENWNIQLADNH